LCSNRLLKPIIVGRIEERAELKGRRGRRRNEELSDLKEMGGYCKLKNTRWHSVENPLWKRLQGCRKKTTE